MLSDRAVLANHARSGHQLAAVRRLLLDPLVVSSLGDTALEYRRSAASGGWYNTEAAVRGQLVYGSPGSTTRQIGDIPAGSFHEIGEQIRVVVRGERMPGQEITCLWGMKLMGDGIGKESYFSAVFRPLDAVGRILALLPKATARVIADSYDDPDIRQMAEARLRTKTK